MPRLASIISEAWQARHAPATEPDRSNERLDDNVRSRIRDRSASDGPALREVAIRVRSRNASATTVVGKMKCAGGLGAGGALVLMTPCGARCPCPHKTFENLAGKANPPLRRGRTVRRHYLARMEFEPLVAFGV